MQVLARYANIEANYRNRVMNDSETFEKVIVDVYVAILQYSAKVKTSQRAGRASTTEIKTCKTRADSCRTSVGELGLSDWAASSAPQGRCDE